MEVLSSLDVVLELVVSVSVLVLLAVVLDSSEVVVVLVSVVAVLVRSTVDDASVLLGVSPVPW